MDEVPHGMHMAHGKGLKMSEDLNHLVNKNAKGRRPQFLGTKAEEHLMSMTMALMQELAVTRERVDTLERVLEQKGILSKPEINTFTPDAEAEVERQAAHHKLIASVMRSMEQEVHALKEQVKPDANELHFVEEGEQVA